MTSPNSLPNSLPQPKSVFERQKAEAEAKRQREQQETAAVYEDFVKSFDDEENETHSARHNLSSNPGTGGSRGTYGAGPPRRHFSNAPLGPSGRGGLSGAAQRSSGPGSLGPPPPSLSRKRTYDGVKHPRDSKKSKDSSLLKMRQPCRWMLKLHLHFRKMRIRQLLPQRLMSGQLLNQL